MFIMWTRGEDKFLPRSERSSFEISKSFLEGEEQVLKVSLHAKQGACSRLWPILENEGVASLQKDIPPLSDRPIRWLPMWWGKNQRRYRIVPRGKNEREREKHLKRFEEWRGRAIIEKGFCLSCLASGSPRYFEFSSDVIDPFYGNFWIFTESIQNFFFFIYVYNAENFEFWILNFHRRKFFSIENFESWIRIESSGIIWNICRELYYMESFEERTMNYLWKDYTRVSYVFFVIVTSVRLFVFRPDICTRYFYKCFKSPFYQ